MLSTPTWVVRRAAVPPSRGTLQRSPRVGEDDGAAAHRRLLVERGLRGGGQRELVEQQRRRARQIVASSRSPGGLVRRKTVATRWIVVKGGRDKARRVGPDCGLTRAVESLTLPLLETRDVASWQIPPPAGAASFFSPWPCPLRPPSSSPTSRSKGFLRRRHLGRHDRGWPRPLCRRPRQLLPPGDAWPRLAAARSGDRQADVSAQLPVERGEGQCPGRGLEPRRPLPLCAAPHRPRQLSPRGRRLARRPFVGLRAEQFPGRIAVPDACRRPAGGARQQLRRQPGPLLPPRCQRRSEPRAGPSGQRFAERRSGCWRTACWFQDGS